METREKILAQASWERSVSEKRAFVRGAEWMLGHLWNKVADIKPADGQRVLCYDAETDLVGIAVFREGREPQGDRAEWIRLGKDQLDWETEEGFVVSPTHWAQITKP